MQLYRFSPINSKVALVKTIEYIASQAIRLGKKITGNEYPIGYLTVFSHYPDEFKNLKKIAFTIGEFVEEVNGPYVKLEKPIQLPNNKLNLLRIRKPDPYRMQVGCCDFKVGNYNKFNRNFLLNKSKNLRLIKRPEYDMIEFFDPDFDVLAYVLSK